MAGGGGGGHGGGASGGGGRQKRSLTLDYRPTKRSSQSKKFDDVRRLTNNEL